MKISKTSGSSTWTRLKYAAGFGICCVGACMLVFFGSQESPDALLNRSLAFDTPSLRQAAPITVHRKLSSSDVVSNVGPKYVKDSLWKNDHNVVHVINTRFLQDQSKLVHLQTARLDLFKTFTVPSLLQQTNRQFLWMIWTDAEETPLQKELISLLQQVPNAVLIGLAQDKDSTFRKLYGHSWTDVSAAVLSGHHQLLADYYSASKTHVLLETRLDADDALSATFVESMQAQAGLSVGDRVRANQKEVYCPESHMEWRYYSGEEDSEDSSSTGKLSQYHNKDFCIFSGLTWAHNVDGNTTFAQKSRALQQGGNNGNNCPIGGGGGGGICDDIRKLEELFELEVVAPAQRNQNRRLHGHGGSDCFHVDVACYKCGQFLECYVADHGASDLQPVLDWLTTPGGSDAFCEIQRNGKGRTCAGQQCTPSSPQVSQAEGLTASLVSDVMPDSCPLVGVAQCPGVEKDLSNFATYEIEYCENGFVGVEACGSKCDSGECECEHGWTEFCGGCDMCRRKLRVIPEEDNAVVETSRPMASVLLARTPTAAGMKNVVPGTKGGGENSVLMNNVVVDWESLEHDFGVGSEAVVALRERFESNMENILIDAFAGQCTPGHSCKESTKRALGLLLDQVQRNKN